MLIPASTCGDFFISITFRQRESLYLYQKYRGMKKALLLAVSILIFSMILPRAVKAQCSICTKTAQQMGQKPAQALNTGIIYLAVAPLSIMGYIGYRWWKSNR